MLCIETYVCACWLGRKSGNHDGGKEKWKIFLKLQQLHIEASYPSEFVLKTLRRCKQHSQVFLASVFQMLQLFKLFMPSLQRFFETPMFDVDARALKTLNHRSRHTSSESLYNVDSKNKKRLHIISRSLRSTAQILPLVDLHKKSSKIKIRNTKSNFQWILDCFWEDRRKVEIYL